MIVFRVKTDILAALAAVLFLLPGVPAFAAAEPAAAEIQNGVTLSVPGGQSGRILRDGSRFSSLVLLADSEIVITSETAFSHIYLIWDRPPDAWRLETEGFPEKEVSGGYLHEAVSCDGPVNNAVIRLGGSGNSLCELYLFTEGRLPDWVQQWQPPLEKADLLVLPTHADDELLFFGGILPLYAGERGLDVQVAYMTTHWDERERPHELLDGLWEVGVTVYPVFGPFEDLYASKDSLAAAEAVYGHDKVLEYQVTLLRRFKPFVAVGHDLNGEYGHGAHMLNAVTLAEAAELTADPGCPFGLEEYGLWEVPKIYLHLCPDNEIIMDWDVPLERFNGATAYEKAVAGFAKHVTQRAYFSVMQSGVWEDCRKFGLVRSSAGPDVLGNDLFENIDFIRRPVPTPQPETPEEAETVPAPVILPAGETESGSGGETGVGASAENPGQSYRQIILRSLAVTLAVLILLLFSAYLFAFFRGRRNK